MTASDHPFEYHIKANLVTLAFICAVSFALMALVPTAGQGWTRHRRVDEGEGLSFFNPHHRTCLLIFQRKGKHVVIIYDINDYCYIT